MYMMYDCYTQVTPIDKRSVLNKSGYILVYNEILVCCMHAVFCLYTIPIML